MSIKEVKKSIDKQSVPNKKLSFLADHFMQMYESQRTSFDAFDQKVSWFLIFQSGIFIYFLDRSFLAALILLVSITLCVFILYPKIVKIAYSPKEILNKFWKESILIEDAQANMVVNISDAIEKNKNIINKKTYLSKYAIVIFLISIIVLFLQSNLFFIILLCCII